jgi:hypothetical protein
MTGLDPVIFWKWEAVLKKMTGSSPVMMRKRGIQNGRQQF